MKIIQVFKPLQTKDTKAEDIQLIDGEIKYWHVQTDRFKLDEDFLGWVTRKKEYIERRSDRFEGIYLYNITPMYQEVHGVGWSITNYIRFDYIKKEPQKVKITHLK